ncbi:MAG: Ribose import ATP-binding protein RbsA [Fimbriimonadales bacterium]|nr:Ribose import ATP-binding protein RbsA [Fimbriimonadales bacterium]
MDGRAIKFADPFEAQRAGISLVHQHFALVPNFTVAENLALASPLTTTRWLDPRQLCAPALEAAQNVGWELDLDARTGSLSVGEQQRIEIVRALAAGGKVLLFDEPTATLSAAEVADLFRVMRIMKDAGRAIVFISHKLDEVMEIADRVTVMRRGEVVAQGLEIAETSPEALARLMVGEVEEPAGAARSLTSEPALVAEDVVSVMPRAVGLNGVSFEIRSGEIVGIGGVDGNGQIALAEVAAGLRRPEAGKLSWRGGEFRPDRLRIAYIPQDRRRDGLATEMSVLENLLIDGHRVGRLSRLGVLSTTSVTKWAQRLVEEFDIRADSLDTPVANLSGGNQQKLILARTLSETPELIVAHNPTRGLDVRAASYVHRCLRSAAERGAAVLLITTEVDELIALSDRFFVLSAGRLLSGRDVAELIGGRS